jgi:diguanylate cyclase
MPPCRRAFRRIAAIALLAFAFHWLHAQQASTKASSAAPIVIEGLGKGTFPLSGPWQFHLGDDPTWANPAFDSSHWEQLTADHPWGTQGHAGLTGFAWYRCNIAFTPASGVPPQFSLLMPRVEDAYEIYWNGSLIGRNGKLPPGAVWYSSQPVQTFDLGPLQHGILAVRVWKAPLLSDDSSEYGGFSAAPFIGSSEAIATARAANEFQWLRSHQLHFAANLLCAVIALLSFLLWLRAPARWILFWTAGFALAQPATVLLLDAHMGWPYGVAMGADQVVGAVQDISLWFLLLWLLALHSNPSVCRVTRVFAWIYFVNAALDGILVILTSNPQWAQPIRAADAASTVITFVLETFPLFLVGFALFQRKQFNPARWLVAILAFLDGMMIVFVNVVKQGRQFTAWPIASRIDSPLFFIDGNGISLSTLAGSLLLIAIVYAVYNSIREDQHRQDVLELEKLELQHESNRMRHQAEHDGLTGLWNHRAIVDRLGEEISRSLREKTPLSVILVDVDHFKKVNDTFGHLAGDLVLKEIAAIFTRDLRPYDYAGRYGGEEFLLILSNCGMKNALHRAEQLRQAVESARVVDGETILQVTASFGVTSAISFHYETETVIRAIDAALYQAKNSGRNCIVPIEMDARLHKS